MNRKKIFLKVEAVCMCLPAFFLITVISSFVILNTLKEGLGYIPELSMYALDFSNYADLFGNRVFLDSLSYSFYVALISTVLCIIFGLMLAYLLCCTKSFVIHTFLHMPVMLSYVAAALLIYTTLSDHGLLYHILLLFGIKTKGLNILFGSSGAGVIILNCFKGAPFLALSTVPVLSRILNTYSAAAMNLGASRKQTVMRIIFPLLGRSIFSCALVLFNYQLFSYESFYYLGASTPVSLGVLAYRCYQTSDLRNRAVCMAVNSVMIGIALVTSFLYVYMMRKDSVMPDA